MDLYYRMLSSSHRGCFIRYPWLFFRAECCWRGGGSQDAALPSREATLTDLVRFVFCSACQEEKLERFYFFWKCGVQPVRSLPAPRYPQLPPGVVDDQQVLSAPAPSIGGYGRAPGATTEKKGVFSRDEVEAFVLVISAGSRGWTTATPDDVLDFLRYLDTQRKGTRMVHEASCPGVSRGGATMRPGKEPLARNGTRPSPSEKALSLG